MVMTNPFGALNLEWKAKNIFVAKVVDNNDPDKTKRVKIRIRDLHKEWTAEQLPWARMQGDVVSGHSSMGTMNIPRKGTFVWVKPEDDNGHSFVIIDAVNNESTKTTELEEGYPNLKGAIDHHNNIWSIAEDNTITFTQKSGATLTMSPDGSVSAVAAKDLSIQANGDIVIRGKTVGIYATNGNITAKYSGIFDAGQGGTGSLPTITARDDIEIDEEDDPNF